MVRFVLDDDKVYKVVAESEDAIWVVDYDNPCAPKIVKQDGMKNLKEIPVPDDYIQESVVSRAIYDTARKRLGILSAILSDNAYITNAALRQRALAKIAQDARVSQKTLKRWYYSYLAYGERGLYPVSKIKKSKTLPQEHEKKIASALSKYYYSPKKRSLKTTYEMMLLKYYRNEQRMIVPDHPTYGQFLYYYRKNRDVVRKLISREGIGEYQKNARPLLGKGDAGITTIGYFEIDATVADIYVVSRFDRKPIGRPVLYVAIDIASRMIAGIYVGFEESAEAVLACLANAACDKVDFCKEHGISITADMWPSKGLPGTIYTDRGSDFASFRVKELCSTFNMEITTLPPYRPDLKGYAKRIVGMPGDTLEIKHGQTYINGKIYDEPYLRETPEDLDFGPFQIPSGCYFMMGDNRNNSYDSRYWDEHFVPRDNILSKVYYSIPIGTPETTDNDIAQQKGQ